MNKLLAAPIASLAVFAPSAAVPAAESAVAPKKEMVKQFQKVTKTLALKAAESKS